MRLEHENAMAQMRQANQSLQNELAAAMNLIHQQSAGRRLSSLVQEAPQAKRRRIDAGAHVDTEQAMSPHTANSPDTLTMPAMSDGSTRTSLSDANSPPEDPAPAVNVIQSTSNDDDAEDDYAENEIDLTDAFRSKSRPAASDQCGFCENSDYCLCADTNRLEAKAKAEEKARKQAAQLSGPGSCDRCLNDPVQAARCRELAKYSQKAQNAQGRPSVSIQPKPEPTVDTKPAIRMPCSDFIMSIPAILGASQDQNSSQYQEVFSKMHAHPYEKRDLSREGAKHSPAMEFDATEAALALEALSKSTKPEPLGPSSTGT